MSIKLSLGKLQIGKPLTTLVAEQQHANHIQLLTIQPNHALAVQELPHHHKDPFDRMLIVQSAAESMPLLSHDPTLKLYQVRVEWQ